jgi:hypothetical protein
MKFRFAKSYHASYEFLGFCGHSHWSELNAHCLLCAGSV